MAWKMDSPDYGYAARQPQPARRKRAGTKSGKATHCVHCGHALEDGFSGCPGCGKPVAAIRWRPSEGDDHCTRCNRILKPEYRFCPGCRQELQPEDLTAVCACGTYVENDWQHCGGCGAPRPT